MENVDTQELKQNLQDGGAWMRLFYILLFAVIYSVGEVVLTMVVIFQFFCVLFTGGKNAQVLKLGGQLSDFLYHVLRYLTYNTDERPYPFSDWPSGSKAPEAAAKPATAKSSKKPATRKAAAPRKSTTRKAPAKPRRTDEQPATQADAQAGESTPDSSKG